MTPTELIEIIRNARRYLALHNAANDSKAARKAKTYPRDA